MTEMNRIFNSKNSYQGDAKRVLCVCSAGLLRSPTTAKILCSEPYNFNTRAAGAEGSFALVPVDRVLLHWADEIVFMEKHHRDAVVARFGEQVLQEKPYYVLGVPDNYPYCDPELMALIKEKYDRAVASKAFFLHAAKEHAEKVSSDEVQG